VVGFGAWAIGGGGWSFGWGPQDDAATLKPTAADLDTIAAAITRTGAGAGPSRPAQVHLATAS
jgi:hypothetical protein